MAGDAGMYLFLFISACITAACYFCLALYLFPRGMMSVDCGEGQACSCYYTSA